MTSNIEELAAAAKAGSRPAFDELVKLTHAETFTLALRLTNNAEDAADVVQEAYLRAFRSMDRFRGDAKFTTWLYRITANCASTQLTKRGRHRHSELDDEMVLADPRHDLEARVDNAAEREQIALALAELPEGLRAVVVLRDIYDLPHEAIARELGITEVTAKVRLHRARKRLRDQLAPRREGVGDAKAG